MKKYKLKSFSAKDSIDYQTNLNPQQLKVVKEASQSSLVLAGAGSGKTRVLIYRLAYLLEKGISPQQILLVTFTNRAATEMINRAETLLKSNFSNLWSGTFHHIGNIILRKESKNLDYSSNFTIVDAEDAKDLIDDCFEDLGISNKGKILPKKDIIYTLYNLACNSQKSIELTIKEYYSYLENYTQEIKKIISYYNKKKKKSQVMDFCDLLVNWLKLLENKNICEKYSKIFQYILVDEYQDTNRLQFKILKSLSYYHKNILVVGDDAQSIYSFRAADIKNILDFPKEFPETKIFKLEVNYRSSPQILSLANQIIKHNINQFPKTLKSIKEDGDFPCVVETKDVYQQAKFLGQRILELNQEGIALNQIAILFRSRYQALEIEMELIKRNIPYLIRGGLRFFEQAHIKDVLAYLKIILNPKDELSFKRAICLHKGIGRGFAYKIWNKLLKAKKLKEIATELPKRQLQGFKEFSAIFESLKKTKKPEAALRQIIKNYQDYCYLSFNNPDERIMDLEELAKMSSNYQTINDFLADLGSFEEFKGETILGAKEDYQTLVLSTIHQAKGLEWEAVFIVGFCDYDFPHPKSLKSKESLEEERRLFYVATTRAKSLLYITYPQTKYTFKNGIILTRPSKFLDEIPHNHYEEMIIEDNFLECSSEV